MKLKIAFFLFVLGIIGLSQMKSFSQNGGMNEKSGTPTYVTELHVLTALVGNVALIVDTIASPTADLASFRNNGTAQVKIGPNGHVILKRYTKTQIDTLVPDHGAGDLIEDTNGTLANQVCIATGTLAAQWQALQGPSTLGCGSNN
jgi:hypothetical protein